MRIIGAILLGCGFGGVGLGAVIRMAGRVADLNNLILGLEGVKRELSFSMDRLERVMEAAANCTRGNGRDFFLHCKDRLGRPDSRSFCDVWSEGIGLSFRRLKPCDLVPLQGLGTVLGRYDAPEQIAAVERTVGRLDANLTQAKGEQETLGKVYGTLGVSVGAIAAILLI